MAPIQERLIAAFSAFRSQIEESRADTDLHVMVVDTDAAGGEVQCESRECRDVPLAGSETECDGYVCGSLAELDECDPVLGAGVVHPLGGHATNTRCAYPEGRRWLKGADPGFEDLFACSARVGSTGAAEEQLMGAALAALEETRDGGCNEGFLRDGAMLVVVFVSDATPFDGSQDEALHANPRQWREQLLSYKCGREERAIVLGFIHDGSESPFPPSACEPYFTECCDVCPPGTAPSTGEDHGDPCHLCMYLVWGGLEGCWQFYTGPHTAMAQFITLFGERGTSHELCTADFGASFRNAVTTIIDPACYLM